MNLQSLGDAAQQHQIDPGLTETGLRANEAEPALVLNGLRYYRSADLERAVKWIAETERECLTR